MKKRRRRNQGITEQGDELSTCVSDLNNMKIVIFSPWKLVKDCSTTFRRKYTISDILIYKIVKHFKDKVKENMKEGEINYSIVSDSKITNPEPIFRERFFLPFKEQQNKIYDFFRIVNKYHHDSLKQKHCIKMAFTHEHKNRNNS